MTRWRTISETSPANTTDADAAGHRRAVRPLAREPGADDDVGVAGEDRLEQPVDLARVVLPVSVDLDREFAAAAPGPLDTGLHGAADAEVERKLDDFGAGATSDGGRLVGRAVVDDDDLELGLGRPELGDDARDRVGLVEGRDDGRFPHTAFIGGSRRTA